MTDKRKEAENLEETRKFAKRVAQLQYEKNKDLSQDDPPDLADPRSQAAYSEYEKPTNPNHAVYNRAVEEENAVRQTVNTPFTWGQNKGSSWGAALRENVSPETRERVRGAIESYAEGMDQNYRRPQREPNKYEFQLAKAMDNAERARSSVHNETGSKASTSARPVPHGENDTRLAAEDVGSAIADKEAGMQKSLGDRAIDENNKIWEPGGYLDRAGEALYGLVSKKKK